MIKITSTLYVDSITKLDYMEDLRYKSVEKEYVKRGWFLKELVFKYRDPYTMYMVCVNGHWSNFEDKKDAVEYYNNIAKQLNIDLMPLNEE